MMDEVILAFTRTVLSMISYTIMFVVLLNRQIKEYKTYEEFNISRFLVILLVISLFGPTTISILTQTNPSWATGVIELFESNPVYYQFIEGTTVLFGLSFIAYINSWRIWQYTPLFFYLCAVVFYFGTFQDFYITFFIYVGGVIALIGVYEVGIRLRDNNAFGLALYMSGEFIAMIIGAEMIILYTIIYISAQVIGIVYSFGKLKIFRDDIEEELEEIELKSDSLDNLDQNEEHDVVPVYRITNDGQFFPVEVSVED